MDILKIYLRILDSRLQTSCLFPELVSKKYSGFFLHACMNDMQCIESNKTILISTGIAIKVLDKTVNIDIKSIFNKNKALDIVIGSFFSFNDFFYERELKISVWNHSKKKIFIRPGDKIAQLFIFPNRLIKFIYF